MKALPPAFNNAPAITPRILIVRVGAMGDVLHGLPAVAALRAALPTAHIAWAIEPRWAPLLYAPGASAWTAEMRLVDGVHLVTAREWSTRPLSLSTIRSVLSVRRALRNETYDIAIDLQGTIRSAVIARMSGASRIIGSNHPRESIARYLYTERVPLTSPHVVQQATELAAHAAGMALAPTVVPIPFYPDAEQWCDVFLQQRHHATSRIIFLAPTAGWGAKQWPPQHFGALAQHLSALGYRVLVNANPTGQDATAGAVVAASGNTAQPIPCTLPQLIALLRRTTLVIAGDTGPLHLAAALGVPTVALFGPTDPARNGPWRTSSRVLRASGSITDHRRHANIDPGLATIGVNAVLEAASELLEGQHTQPG